MTATLGRDEGRVRFAIAADDVVLEIVSTPGRGTTIRAVVP